MRQLYYLAAASALMMSADAGGAGGLDLGPGPGDAGDGGAATAAAADGAAAAPAAAPAAPAARAASPAKVRRGAAAAAAEVLKEDDGLVEAVVARGTVVTGTFADPVHNGPGSTVRLSAKEVEKLRADGVLVDPNAAPLPEWQGPTVGRG